jgi:SAM-dependent methyltransferase
MSLPWPRLPTVSSRNAFEHLFRCPACRGELANPYQGQLRCVLCHSSYGLVGRVPILICSDRSLFDPDEAVNQRDRTPTAVVGFRRAIPGLTNNYNAKRNFRRLGQLLREGAPDPVVLSIGGGEGGKGEDALDGIAILTTDVVLGPDTDALADAHDLPFADGAFDGVVIQAVLEHVLDPSICVAEVHRVLKPGGLVYAETPFMQQVHLGRYDFTRFTALGHRRLFRKFEAIDTGMSAGPGSALAWSLAHFLASFSRGPRMRKVLMALGKCMFFWLRLLDVPLKNNDAAYDAAAGFYFLGRRSEHTLADAELLATYRGGTDL